jgi:ASCH domain
MKVIVIRQPWAWLIVNGYKDIENRSWATKYRGPLLIQASARKPSKPELKYFLAYARKRGVELPDEFDLGGIVGMVRLDDCVEKSRSKWFGGPVGWILSKPKRLLFVAMKGQLGLFNPPLKVLKKLGLAK